MANYLRLGHYYRLPSGRLVGLVDVTSAGPEVRFADGSRVICDREDLTPICELPVHGCYGILCAEVEGHAGPCAAWDAREETTT